MKKTRPLRSRLLRSPTFWLMVLLIVAAAMGSTVRAWRVYQIGWIADYNISSYTPHVVAPAMGRMWRSGTHYQYNDYVTFRREPDGSLIVWSPRIPQRRDEYVVRLDMRLYRHPYFNRPGTTPYPRLYTCSIREIELFAIPNPEFPPIFRTRAQSITVPYPQDLVDAIDISLTNPTNNGGYLSVEFTRYDGVIPSKMRFEGDGSTSVTPTGTVRRTPENKFAYYRVAGGDIDSPLIFEDFILGAQSSVIYTMPLPTAIYLFGYICYYRCFFLRRKNKRLRLGQCIKCAYPMQPDRDGPGTLCTECGYRPPDEQAP
ncbi:MAG: hypothetical protein JKX70_08045 [Phycisphaerales bacterium]|nr:hypothetical protein [Phycisphaerales bacterium]